MADPEMPSTGAVENTPPHDPYEIALTLDIPSHESEDGSEEWEYEYSNTETETYYVTLDLTTPNIAPKHRAKRTAGYEGMKPKWINPGLSRIKRRNLTAPAQFKAVEADEEAETPAQTPPAEADNDPNEDEDALGSLECAGSLGKSPDADVNAAEVQILDLHTKNPIVQYDGHIFSCQWAANIGTELLFTEHDETSTLPVLRNLAGDVDLLAASSVRIISKSVKVEPKPSIENVTTTPRYPMDSRGNDSSISLPVGAKAMEQRKDQARFLEKLIKVKNARGDQDNVTVITARRLLKSGWRTEMAKRRQTERVRLKKVVKSSNDVEAVEKAKKRLVEIDKEDQAMKVKRKEELGKRASELRRNGKQKASSEQPAEDAIESGITGLEGTEGVMGYTGIYDGPTPEEQYQSTPQGWDVEGYEEEMEEGLLYDEDELGDEDAPGEDEDIQMAYGWS